MKTSSISLLLAALMGAVSLAGFAAKPAHKTSMSLTLDTAVPARFGDWTELQEQSAQVINPQMREVINKLYSQTLSRTYVNKDGYRIMLSVAYGDDQRGGLQAHRPEVCYPAQGFAVERIEDGTLALPLGSIPVRRMQTSFGERKEPVTYWLTVGNEIVMNAYEKRWAEFRLALTGQVPDGLLFRVSSIDRDPARAFAMQRQFTMDMMAAVPAKVRTRLGGPVTTDAASS